MTSFKKNPPSITNLLKDRAEKSLLRSLNTNFPLIDFSSNDYLGFSTRGYLFEEIKAIDSSLKIGSTGSRLISGNSNLFEQTESYIAQFHLAESALIYNSGYDANLGLLSCVPQKGDLILSDELIHASLIDGIRLSFATHYKFKHNDTDSLKELVVRYRDSYNEIYIVVESVYSMDGDCSPLLEMNKICEEYNLHLIVDEAHAIGLYGKQGRGMCNELQIEDKCFARIYTYGKAMGCHGAAVVGSKELKDYLINFSRSFIYTTAMPEHSLIAIKAAYQLLNKTSEIDKLKNNIAYFNSKLIPSYLFIESISSIHCLLVAGNIKVEELENKCLKNNVFVKAIRSPTVKAGKERLRICLHSFNTTSEMDHLFECVNS